MIASGLSSTSSRYRSASAASARASAEFVSVTLAISGANSSVDPAGRKAMAVEIDGGGATHLSQALVGAIATADSQSQQIHGVLVAPLRHSLHERFRTAVLAEGVDREMLAETVAAQLIMRVLFAEPITEEWIAALVELVAQERLHA